MMAMMVWRGVLFVASARTNTLAVISSYNTDKTGPTWNLALLSSSKTMINDWRAVGN